MSAPCPARNVPVCPLRNGSSRNLAELRAPEFARLVGPSSILVQPLGAVEQHGPHLPFNTDLLIAERVATAAVERVGEELDVWILPPLAYTKSNEHAWSAGTIWLSATTLLAVLDDIGRCVAATGARKLVFFNGHGGNSALVGVANREIRLAHGLMTFLAHPGVPSGPGRCVRQPANSAWESTGESTRRR
jgi:creatinine amidohydrolase